jgi:hypothetical protein
MGTGKCRGSRRKAIQAVEFQNGEQIELEVRTGWKKLMLSRSQIRYSGSTHILEKEAEYSSCSNLGDSVEAFGIISKKKEDRKKWYSTQFTSIRFPCSVLMKAVLYSSDILVPTYKTEIYIHIYIYIYIYTYICIYAMIVNSGLDVYHIQQNFKFDTLLCFYPHVGVLFRSPGIHPPVYTVYAVAVYTLNSTI